MGISASKNDLEDTFRNSPGFLSSKAGVERRESHRWVSQGLQGYAEQSRISWTCCYFIIICRPSSPHSFHSICVKKRSFLTAPPRFTSLWRHPSIASMWVSSPVANHFLQGFYHTQKNLSGYLGLNPAGIPTSPKVSIHVLIPCGASQLFSLV